MRERSQDETQAGRPAVDSLLDTTNETPEPLARDIAPVAASEPD
jgi:hypothetical protein